MTATATKTVGPNDHGRRMRLDEFDHAKGAPGYQYELYRGVVVVIDVPKGRHLAQMKVIKRQIHNYDASHPGTIDTIATGSECKILLAGLESERHPDLAIYKTPMPNMDDPWRNWIPEIVIEVVSPTSRKRDYEEKTEEYFQAGVEEYWIFDADTREMTVFQRSDGGWRKRAIRPPETYTTELLPNLHISCADVFDAAR